MTAIIAQLGAILLQLGSFATLIVLTPVLYGVVIIMRRWWLVVASALLLAALVMWLATDAQVAEAVAQMPAAMLPQINGYVAVAIAYVGLATLVRLSTLRLEWLGWKSRTVQDIHVLAFLAPTVAAAWLTLAPAA